MTNTRTNRKRIIAIDPTIRGIAFAVFEGPDRLIDWGVKQARADKQVRCLKYVDELIRWYTPTSIVLEDVAAAGSRRSVRVKELLAAIAKTARDRNVRPRLVARTAVLKQFGRSRAANKDEVAAAVAARFPELAPRLPAKRKPWQSEAERLGIFDAVAFGLMVYHSD
mgnify:CR=1 FL=1